MPASQHIIASPTTWMDDLARRQLAATVDLPGMTRVVGMPDLHAGRHAPIGAAYVSSGFIHPALVGGDIGCGMALWSTTLQRRKIRLAKWVDRLQGIEGRWDGDAAEWLAARGAATEGFDWALGTIGGGNHFAEVQVVETVLDQATVDRVGIDARQVLILVHSGSRGLGQSILDAHLAREDDMALASNSTQAHDYLLRHDQAVKWARANRALTARRLMERLKGGEDLILDSCHNSVVPLADEGPDVWLHRKGATPANEGLTVIPGSRGSLTYLVRPLGNGIVNAHSLAHGAGRRWQRSSARARLSSRYRASDLVRTALGGWVICEDRDLLYEEAPEAYKDIDAVVSDLVDAGVAEIVATLRPVITYKLRSA